MITLARTSLDPPACPETVANGEPGGLLGSVVSVERVLEFGGWDVAAVLVQAPVVVPVDPFGGGELGGVDAAPGAAVPDHFGLVQAVHRLPKFWSLRTHRGDSAPSGAELHG